MLRTTLCLLSLLTAAKAQVVISMLPTDTFLRTEQDPGATLSFAIPLQAAGVLAGDWLRLRMVGDWDAGGGGDVQRELIGVFAGGSTLLAANLQQRVPAPVTGGTSFLAVSGTAIGNLPTDITQDFWIARNGASDEVTVRVPAGAVHLFVCVPDSFYSDNTDPDFDLGVEITLVPTPAYPGTGGEDLLLGSGVLGPVDLIPIKTAVAGNTVSASVYSPLDLLPLTAIVIIVADVIPTGTPPAVVLPDTWFGVTAVFALVDVMQPHTRSQVLQVPIPTGFAGQSLWLQGAAVWANARNGLFLTSEAHEVRLL